MNKTSRFFVVLVFVGVLGTASQGLAYPDDSVTPAVLITNAAGSGDLSFAYRPVHDNRYHYRYTPRRYYRHHYPHYGGSYYYYRPESYYYWPGHYYPYQYHYPYGYYYGYPFGFSISVPFFQFYFGF